MFKIDRKKVQQITTNKLVQICTAPCGRFPVLRPSRNPAKNVIAMAMTPAMTQSSIFQNVVSERCPPGCMNPPLGSTINTKGGKALTCT